MISRFEFAALEDRWLNYQIEKYSYSGMDEIGKLEKEKIIEIQDNCIMLLRDFCKALECENCPLFDKEDGCAIKIEEWEV